MNKIFDASDFMTRDHCGKWDETWMNLYLLGNGATMTAYFLYPIALAFGIWRVERAKRRAFAMGLPVQLPLLSRIDAIITAILSIFIPICGAGHGIDGILAFFWPAYRFFALWHDFTGFVSLATMFWLFYRSNRIVAYFYVPNVPSTDNPDVAERVLLPPPR